MYYNKYDRQGCDVCDLLKLFVKCWHEWHPCYKEHDKPYYGCKRYKKPCYCYGDTTGQAGYGQQYGGYDTDQDDYGYDD